MRRHSDGENRDFNVFAVRSRLAFEARANESPPR